MKNTGIMSAQRDRYKGFYITEKNTIKAQKCLQKCLFSQELTVKELKLGRERIQFAIKQHAACSWQINVTSGGNVYERKCETAVRLPGEFQSGAFGEE